MIRYTLVCDNGHDFEGWFRSSDSYDAQAADGLVECLACGSTRVAKAMMAPALAKTVAQLPGPNRALAEASPTDPAAAPSAERLPMAEPERQLRALMRAVREHVIRTADNVGPQFPEEARRMHYGEAESRPIYGVASPSEARALVEEGIDVAPLPALPGDLN
ncbi:DUF1178 family protein [Methylobacterium sp. WCS2018Hpa-22]|uniref:DUF1178 family protein n=1 Tax=unclassified Methylobacterium TaxID=2615210 RepID=UPI00288C29BF|nr:DUF1178 family protein [Methylobacterium sp. WCS2018Hpa-22]